MYADYDAADDAADSASDRATSTTDWLVYFGDLLISLGYWFAEERISPLHILIFLSVVLSSVCFPYLTWPPVKMYALRLQDWYLTRLEAHRIDQIWDQQPVPSNAVWRSLFPSWFPLSLPSDFGPFPLNLITVLVKLIQLMVFSVHFPKVAAQVLVGLLVEGLRGVCRCVDMLIAETVRRCPRRVEEFVKALFDLEEVSWQTLITCAAIVPWLFRTLGTVLSSCHVGLKLLAMLYIRRVLRKREREECLRRPDFDFTEESKNAWRWAFRASYLDTVETFMDLQSLREKYDALQSEHFGLKANFPENDVRELANKAKAYRDSLIESISDTNYWRMIICQIMNWQHNVCTHRSLKGPDSQHPYKPSMIRFSVEANPQTGLHLEMNPATESQKAVRLEWLQHTKAFYWDKKGNFFRMPNFMSKKLAGADHFVPPGLDPFKEDTWVIEANFPGIVLAPFDANKNPINVTKKRPVPILQPTRRFGRLIEDVASSGSLLQWRQPQTEKRRLGTDGVRRTMCYPTTPIAQAYGRDPCPDGSPMDITWPT